VCCPLAQEGILSFFSMPTMMTRYFWLTTCFLATSLVAMAQVPAQNDVLVLHSWRVHAGDDPTWARPGFNDSNWQLVEASEGAAQSLAVDAGYRWYRTTAILPPTLVGRELAIDMGPADEVYEVYVEGVSIGRFGHWLPSPASPFNQNLAFPIPPDLVHGPSAHIAVRAWEGKTSTSLFPFYVSGASRFPHPSELGALSTIEDRSQLYTFEGVVRNLPWSLSLFLMGIAGCIALVLFSAQRDHTEYLLLGIYCVGTALAPLVGGIFAASDSVMRRSIGPVFVILIYYWLFGTVIALMARLCPRFSRWLDLGALLYCLLALVVAYAIYAQKGYTSLVFWGVFTYLPIVCFLIAALGLLLDRRPGSFAIAVALLLFQLSNAWVNVLYAVFNLDDLRFMRLGPLAVDIRAIGQALFVFVTLVVLYFRYRERQFQQVSFERDMASARRVQEQLLGQNPVGSTDFIIETAYLPAKDVGGDFYRTVALDDGSLLVVVGDVSGKGLDAAMLVAAVLGSLANETHRSPGSLLTYLNAAACGRTGGAFITACCARFYPDGRIVFANAGHIPPYMDNLELEVETGVPLGIIPGTTYSETEVHASGTLTFISDGVVEASDARGELLGFERTAALAGRSASEIAAAAQRWGQEGDITVVRVGFANVTARLA
jgi:hypothetical protein